MKTITLIKSALKGMVSIVFKKQNKIDTNNLSPLVGKKGYYIGHGAYFLILFFLFFVSSLLLAQPAPPTQLYVISQDKANEIRWNASVSGGITEHRLFRSEDSTSWTQIANVPVGTNNYTDNGLTNNKFYFYKATAWDGFDESTYSNADGSTPDVAEISKYMHFDGQGGYLVASDTNKLMAVNFMGSSTLECWVRLDTITSQRSFILSREYNSDYPASSGTALNWYSLYNKNGKFIFKFNPTGNTVNADSIISTLVAETDKWYHISISYEYLGGLGPIRLYINGKLEVIKNVSNFNILENVGSYPDDSRLLIGAHTTGFSPFTYDNFFKGDIAEVSYWTTYRDSTDIKTSMLNRLRGDEPDLIGLWHLDAKYNNSVYDYNDLNFNAIVHGNACVNTPQATTVNDLSTILASTATTIDVQYNDTCSSDRDVVKTEIVNGPTNGVVNIINNDSIRYNPGCFVGNDTITYLIYDTSFFNNPIQYSDTASLFITIENNLPDITSDGGGASATKNVVENTTTVTTLVATDQDACHSKNYFIAGGADADSFNINPSTGVLIFTSTPDFENPGDAGTNNVYNVTVSVSDGYDTVSQNLAITVTNGNDVPTDINLTSTSVDENKPSVTAVGTFSTIDDDSGDSHIYTLVAGVGDTNNASFQIFGDELRTNVGYNFEVKNKYTIRVRTTDNGAGNLTFEKIFIIRVNDVNDAPSFTKGVNQTVNEDITARSITNWATGINDNDGSAQTLSFDVTNDNNALFIVQPAISSTGTLTYTLAPDVHGTTTVDVVLKDNGGIAKGGVDSTVHETFTIKVDSVNDAPSFTGGGNQTTSEDTGPQTVIWATGLSTGPANESWQTLIFTVTNDNTSLFSMQPAINSSGELTYSPSPDANGSATVYVVLKDNGGTANGGVDSTLHAAFTIVVNPVNEAPTDISLSGNSMAENLAPGAHIGNLFSMDEDTTDLHTYTLVAGTGSVDNASFQIVDNELRSSAVFDYETQKSYSLRIRTTDNGNGFLFYEKVFIINVTDENDAPTEITLDNDNIDEGLPGNTSIGLFKTLDQDSSDNHSYDLVPGIGDTDNGQFRIVGNELRTHTQLIFKVQSSFTIRVRTTDNGAGNLSYEKNFNIVVNEVNTAPHRIILTQNRIDENAPVNTEISALVTLDVDSGDVHTYHVLNGLDGAYFDVRGNTLISSETFNYELKQTYSMTLRTTDVSGANYDTTLIVYVNDINEAPKFIDQFNKDLDTLRYIIEADDTLRTCPYITDEDGDETVYVAMQVLNNKGVIYADSNSKNCVVFEPDISFRGLVNAFVVITDNGIPALTDTLHLVIELTEPYINHHPVIVDEQNESTDTLFYAMFRNEILEFCINAIDPEGEEISLSSARIVHGSGELNVIDNSSLCLELIPEIDFLGQIYIEVIVNDHGTPILSDLVVISISVEPLLEFSQAISPNSDGISDYLYINGIEEFPDNKITIFNRWGDIIYLRQGYNNQDVNWEGQANNDWNRIVPDGTYFYILEIDGYSKQITGFIVLKR